MKNRKVRLCLSIALALAPILGAAHYVKSHKHAAVATDDGPPGSTVPCPPCFP